MAAKQAYSTELIKLQNDEEVRLRPLSIKGLKEFNKLMRADIETDEEGNFDNLGRILDLSLFCLERMDRDKYGSERREELEDILDLDTSYEIIRVCGGIDLEMKVDVEDFQRLIETEANGTTTS